MKKNSPKLTRTDNPNWDCLVFRNQTGDLDYRLIPVQEFVLVDTSVGIPIVDILPRGSLLNLEQRTLGYQPVNHKDFKTMKDAKLPQYPTNPEPGRPY